MANRPGGVRPGKRVVLAALRAHELRKPGEDAHPKIRSLYHEAVAVAVTWRVLYNLPPTAPAYLAMSLDDMADDLLQRRFHELRIFYAQNPGAEAEHDEAKARELAELEQQLATDAAWHAQIRRVALAARREHDPLTPRGGFAEPAEDEAE